MLPRQLQCVYKPVARWPVCPVEELVKPWATQSPLPSLSNRLTGVCPVIGGGKEKGRNEGGREGGLSGAFSNSSGSALTPICAPATHLPVQVHHQLPGEPSCSPQQVQMMATKPA